MDFDEYVAARWGSLVRSAVLLGSPEDLAPDRVTATLLDLAHRIDRVPDPDPLVHGRLAIAARGLPSAPPPAGTGPALDLRRSLASLDRTRREVAVLGLLAGLSPHETARALGMSARAVLGLEAELRTSLGLGDVASARLLMAAAADSVRVPATPALARPPRSPRRSALVTAAAMAAAAVLAGLLVAGGEDRGGRMPSLVGYDAAAARAALRQLGLEVVERPARACEPVGLVVGTEPAVGTPYDEGESVVLRTAAPSDIFCMARYPDRSDAWELVAFAAGRGPAPEFAHRVAVVVDGSPPAHLTAAEAADPERWGDPSVLTALVDAVGEVYDVPGSAAYRSATLTTTSDVPAALDCGVRRPAAVAGRSALSITVAVPRDGPYRCPFTLDLYRTDGAIDTVVLRTARTPGS